VATTLYLIQNDPAVPPGIISGLLEERQIPFRVIRPDDGDVLPSPEDAEAVIVLGGAMGVGDTDTWPFLLEVKRFIRECADRDIPFLGICLGGQLLAEVLGTHVTSRYRGEKGVCRVRLTAEGAADQLFRGISPEFFTYQWHDDSFDLPAGCRLLASSPDCCQQAIRHGATVYGVQFHPEVTAAIVTSWSGDSTENAGYLPAFLRTEEEYLASARTLLDNFFRIARLVN
jgi:GMP synthase-like glutamine amidotransferase